MSVSLQQTIGFMARQLTNNDSFGAYLEPIVQLFKPEWRHDCIAAKVVFIKNENHNIYTLTLKPESQWNGFKAGQHLQLSCEKDGALYTRTFSLSCSPKSFSNRKEISLTIRRQDQGLITPWLSSELLVGSTVYLSQAQGQFRLSSSSKDKVFIAGGSGLTPLYSMLSESQNEAWFKQAELLFYVNNQEDEFFSEKLSHLEEKGLSLTKIYTSKQGRISNDQLESLITSPANKEYYVCGPGEMISTAQTLLQEIGVTGNDIHSEYFGSQSPQKHTLPTEDDSDEIIQVDYLDSRKQVTYSPDELLRSQSSTLLEIAESEGLNPVSGCRMGVCHQCICKKKTGRVFNTRTQEYSDSGAEEIQLCVSIPVGKVELEL